MARKIIIQERINEPSDFSFRYIMWADVPATRQSQYADPDKTSLVKDITTGELQAIKDGKVIEIQETAEFVAGTPIATIQAELIKRQGIFQAKINAANPWKFYGTSYDGTSWTVKQTT